MRCSGFEMNFCYQYFCLGKRNEEWRKTSRKDDEIEILDRLLMGTIIKGDNYDLSEMPYEPINNTSKANMGQ